MNKSNKNKTKKTNPLDNIIKNVEKYNDLYDNVIVDGNELKLESQLRKEIDQKEKRKVSNWQLMKEVAQDNARKGNTKELNDLLKIERKMRKKTNTAQRTAPKAASPIPTLPLDFVGYDDFKKLVYRGRLDDSSPGNGKEIDGKDLRSAIDSLLTGKKISSKQFPSMGCNIKWK